MIIIDAMLLGILEVLARLKLINTVILPAPSSILMNSDIISILSSFIDTLKVILLVYIISIIFDLVITIMIYLLEFKYLEHFIYRINTFPRILITLIGIALLGVGYQTIGIVSIISSSPNFIITVLGYLRNENNKKIIEAAKDMGANDVEIILKILIPTNTRGIIIALKILFSNIMNSVIIGEYLISAGGIGSLLQYNLFMYNMKNVWMIAIIIMLFSIVVSKIFDFILKSKKMWFNL